MVSSLLCSNSEALLCSSLCCMRTAGDDHWTNLEKKWCSRAVYSVHCACEVAALVTLLHRGLSSYSHVNVLQQCCFRGGDYSQVTLTMQTSSSAYSSRIPSWLFLFCCYSTHNDVKKPTYVSEHVLKVFIFHRAASSAIHYGFMQHHHHWCHTQYTGSKHTSHSL